MANNGYLRCCFSDPGSDYVSSKEIFDVDENGFSVGIGQGTIHFGKKESLTKEDAEYAKATVIKWEKDWCDKYGKEYPDWFNHEFYVKEYSDDCNDLYMGVCTKERINVPLDYIKEHSKDNWPYGMCVKRPSWNNATDIDKELFRALGEWITNVRWSEEAESYVAHTWSLD